MMKTIDDDDTLFTHQYVQWLNCNKIQGNAVSLPPFIAEGVPSPQMNGKGKQWE